MNDNGGMYPEILSAAPIHPATLEALGRTYRAHHVRQAADSGALLAQAAAEA